eukprot:UN02117
MNDEQLAEFDRQYRQSFTHPYTGFDHADQLLHNVAFNNIGIGSSPIPFLSSLIPSTSTQQQQQQQQHEHEHYDLLFPSDLVTQWHRATFTRNRISVTGANLSHAAFMKSNEQLIQKIPNSNLQHIPLPQTAYNPRKHVHHIEGDEIALNKSDEDHNNHHQQQRQHIRVGFLAPSITHEDNLTAVLLSSVLHNSNQQFNRYWQYSDVGLLSLGQSYLNPSTTQRDDIIEDMFLTMNTRLRYDIHNENVVKNAKSRIASHYQNFATATILLLLLHNFHHIYHINNVLNVIVNNNKLNKTESNSQIFYHVLIQLIIMNLEKTLNRILKSPSTIVSYTEQL